MQQTLVILKPCAIQRGIAGDIISRFEKKGLQIVGMKMAVLSDQVLESHYAHLKNKPFFERIKKSMQASPVILMVVSGINAVEIVRKMTGATNGRDALPGTIRGDFSMSVQENIVHASDSPETAEIEIKRFFAENEIYEYQRQLLPSIYANDEY